MELMPKTVLGSKTWLISFLQSSFTYGSKNIWRNNILLLNNKYHKLSIKNTNSIVLLGINQSKDTVPQLRFTWKVWRHQKCSHWFLLANTHTDSDMSEKDSNQMIQSAGWWIVRALAIMHCLSISWSKNLLEHRNTFWRCKLLQDNKEMRSRCSVMQGVQQEETHRPQHNTGSVSCGQS